MDKVIDQPPEVVAPLSEGDEKKKTKFLAKEILDRIAYGLSSQQFLNILFIQSGASLFSVGLINGLKVMLSVIVSYFLSKFHVSRRINKAFMSVAGILFGISLFAITIALKEKSTPLFILAFLFGSAIAVLYGTLYQDWFKENLEMKKRGFFLSRIGYYGIGITGVSMILGAYLVDRYSYDRIVFSAFGYLFRLEGFVVVFILSAIFFMIASLMLLLIKEKNAPPKERVVLVTKETWKNLFSNKVLIVLFLSSSIVSLVQTLATAYYGIYIFQTFSGTGYGGFMNVAIIFLIALLTSMVGPIITQFNARAYGKFPMLVFGTILMAIGPVTFYYNPTLLSISVAMFLSTIGSSICGVAFGLLTMELVREDMKDSYASLSNILTLIPYAIFVPAGAYFAQTFGMQALFLILTITLILVVVPMYLGVLLIYNTKRQKI